MNNAVWQVQFGNHWITMPATLAAMWHVAGGKVRLLASREGAVEVGECPHTNSGFSFVHPSGRCHCFDAAPPLDGEPLPAWAKGVGE